MNIEQLFHKHKLNTLERKLIQYLFDNIDSIKKIGIRKLALDNFTSTSIIYKMVKKLGFSGYSDMIHYIAYAHSEKKINRKPYKYAELYSSVAPYKKDINALLNQYKHNRIIVIGTGFSSIIANFISEVLFVKGFNSAPTLHLEFLLPKYQNEILLIVVSESGETTRSVELIKEARLNNFNVITFTANKNSSLAKLSTLCIPIGDSNELKSIYDTSNTFFGELLLALADLIE